MAKKQREHGLVSTYHSGCRCDLCKAAMRDLMREKRAHRKAKGLCLCGEPPLPGKKSCAHCTEISTAKFIRNRERNRNNDRCDCGNPRLPGKNRCLRCITYHKNLYLDNLRKGLCNCGRPLIPGKHRCSRCCTLTHLRHAKKTRRHKLLGICTLCDRPTVPNRSRCKEHMDRAKLYQNNLRNRKRQQNIAAGKCGCGKERDAGIDMCARCFTRIHFAGNRDAYNRSKGLCSCGAKRETGYKCCKECRDYIREAARKWYRARVGKSDSPT